MLVAVGVSCTGVVVAPASGGGPAPIESCVLSDKPPGTRVRRLTKIGIQNAATIVLNQDATSLLSNLDADSQINGGFSNDDQQVVSEGFANSLNLAADTIGTKFKATVTKTTYDPTCFASDAAGETCAKSFIQTFGKKVFRRGITDVDLGGLIAVYDAGREVGIDGNFGDRFATGLSWVVRAMVQSPSFLYLTELGDPGVASGATTTLLAEEAANAISFSILGMPPDDALTTAANQNELATPEQRATQVGRLMSAYPDHWKQQMRLFVLQWLGINFSKPDWQKNVTALPMFSAALKDAIQTETDMFVDDWAGGAGGARIDALLTTSSTFVNGVNAALYGVSASGGATVRRRRSIRRKERAGSLTLGGFLGSTSHVAQTSPVMRGKAIMQKFMCADPPAPPPNVPPLPPVDKSAPTTTRARYEAHLANATCSGCHGNFEPMGNAFEMFDALGGFRTEENGFPVDSSGVLVGASGGDKPVANALELVRLLADSPRTHQCVARQIFRFTVGRAEAAYDDCMLVEAAKGLGSGASDLRAVVIKIVSSDSFVVRTVNKE